jgi:hypothetical protein
LLLLVCCFLYLGEDQVLSLLAPLTFGVVMAIAVRVAWVRLAKR